MRPAYPFSFDTIGAWARENAVSANEARVRFAQYAVLQSIAAVRQLREGLVFKGGNALDFVWQPNRSTVDLDFSVDHKSALATPDADTIQTLLERGNGVAIAATGILLVVHQVRRNPPGEDRHFVTFQGRVGYSLPDQARLRQRMEQGERSPQVIDLDISINEPIGDARIRELSSGVFLRVATIEDIVAEKLRALLQQPIRNRHRRQDLLDIAVVLRENATFDRGLVAAFLLTKAEARGVPVSRAAFRNPEVAERASVGYAELQQTTRVLFVPYEEALTLLHEFVNNLEIPD
jgi:predicted nucleotidyltransferase component of viral defense system